MKKEFIIKKSPLQKIVLRKNEFEIINDQYKKENGVFSFSKTYHIEFRAESTDYQRSIFYSFLSFLIPGGHSHTIKTKERIAMNYDGKEIVFILFDFDKEVVMKAISEIQKRIK